MQISYCEECRSQVSASDLEFGGAARIEGKIFCRKCAEKLFPGAIMEATPLGFQRKPSSSSARLERIKSGSGIYATNTDESRKNPGSGIRAATSSGILKKAGSEQTSSRRDGSRSNIKPAVRKPDSGIASSSAIRRLAKRGITNTPQAGSVPVEGVPAGIGRKTPASGSSSGDIFKARRPTSGILRPVRPPTPKRGLPSGTHVATGEPSRPTQSGERNKAYTSSGKIHARNRSKRTQGVDVLPIAIITFLVLTLIVLFVFVVSK
jgi:hypothetical protein